MKTPSNKVKAQFFALYLGQKVLTHTKEDFIMPLTTDMLIVEDGWHLLLRSIEQLTNDEYYELGILLGKYIFKPEHYEKIHNTKDVITQAKLYCVFEHRGSMFSNLATDYLRLKGIIRPFTYLSEDNKPITLSPSEIIALGWVKITKP